MAKGPMYVKDFNFSSAGKTVGRCDDGMTKMASGGYYSKGGSAKAGQDVQMAKSNAVAKSLVGQKATPYAKGGIKEAATGEMYPSRRAMMKHESLETPRMQRDEVMQSRTVKAPMRRQMPVAPSAPMIQASGMKKGGFVKGGTGMVKTEGTLGIKGNKNPGERNGKPTTATKTGNVPFKSGGAVKKYADGGPAAPAGALNQMAQQAQRPMPQPFMGRQKQPPMQQPQRPMAPQPMNQQQMQQQALDAYRRQGQNQGLAPMGGQQPMQNMLQGSTGLPGAQVQTGGQQPSPQMMQQMMAQLQAARAGQGMPGQQGPQGLGQPFGGPQPMPTQQGMQQQAPMGMGLGKFS
jgi:hypothetical protein